MSFLDQANGLVKHHPIKLALAALAILTAFYWDTANARFCDDINSWIIKYMDNTDGFAAIFQYKPFLPGYHFLQYGLWRLVGSDVLSWHVLFISLHWLDGILLYLLLCRISALQQIRYYHAKSFMASLLFLLLPYQTQVIVWGATIHYLVITALIIVCLYLLIEYAVSGKKSHLLIPCFLFLPGMYTLELMAVLPFLSGVFWLTLPANTFKGVSRKGFFTKVVIGQFALFISYFLFNLLFSGNLTHHYGDEVHMSANIPTLFRNLERYTLQYFAFLNSWPDQFKLPVFKVIEKSDWWLVGCILTLVVGTWVVYNSLIRKKVIPLSLVMLLCFVAALAPIINLRFVELPIQGGRYGYMASAFSCAALIFIEFRFRWLRQVGFVAFLFYFAVSLSFLHDYTNRWAISGKYMAGLTNDFRWQESKRVFVLCSPDNYKDITIFQGYNDIFHLALKARRGIDMGDRLVEVVTLNVFSLNDSVKTTVIGKNTFELYLGQWGGWFIKNYFGATDHATDNYLLHVKEFAVEVTIIDPSDDDVYLYFTGLEWKEAKLSPSN